MCMVRPTPARDPVTGRFIPKKSKEAEEGDTDQEPAIEGPEESRATYSTTMDQHSFMETIDRMMEQNREAVQAQAEQNREHIRTMLEQIQAPKEKEKAGTLKPSEVYLFKPTSRQDEKSARIPCAVD